MPDVLTRSHVVVSVVALLLTGAVPNTFVREVELVQTEHGTIVARAEGRYKDGQRDGMWAGFWPEGERRWAATYVRGQRHQLFLAWRLDGTLEREEMYRYGKLHGVAKRYAGDGRTVSSEQRYQQGRPVGAAGTGAPLLRTTHHATSPPSDNDPNQDSR